MKIHKHYHRGNVFTMKHTEIHVVHAHPPPVLCSDVEPWQCSCVIYPPGGSNYSCYKAHEVWGKIIMKVFARVCLSHFFCFNWRKQRSHVVPSIKRLKCRVSLSDRSCSDALLVWAPLNQRLVVISGHWHQVGSIESCTLIRGVTCLLCFVICASHFIQSSLVCRHSAAISQGMSMWVAALACK